MYPTRRYWTLVGLGAFFVLFAVSIDRPLALAGAVALSALLVVSQATTVNAFTSADEGLTVEYSLSQSRVTVDGTMFVTMSASQTTASDVSVTVTAQPPLAAHSIPEAERQLHLSPGETTATTSFEVTVPVAGRVELGEPRVELADEQGLFTETYHRGPTEAFTIEPPSPREIHVGQGGEQMLGAYGDHPMNRSGAGLTPAGLRQYIPGDTLNRIDWKATARQATPYVREFEVEAERTTLLVVDHRAAMNVGPAGQTMLDFAREVALGIVQSAEENNDELGFYSVGDAGLTATHHPSVTSLGYHRTRSALHELTPTQRESQQTSDQMAAAHPSTARRASQWLTNDTSVFAEQIQPFLTASDVYVERIQGDPLFEAVRRAQFQASGQTWTIILTDDTDRDRIRETARIASKRGHSVLVFMTPTVLFETGTLADLDTAYERYVDFEEFRRELQRLPRVTGFEVGPGDHLETILQMQRARPQQQEEPTQ